MSARNSNPATGVRPSSIRKNSKGSAAAASKIPACKDGKAPDPSHPCTPKIKKSVDKRKTFRVPLKKEDGNMEAQIIEYNAETPNRVVIRLEFLMQSTKVRLNDRHYMDDFYSKLLEEETRVLNRATKAREQTEMNRMKKLIIDGLMADIPPELWYLHRHPVFRVNQMLARLKRYESTLVNDISEDEIIPIEPYEYNGNEFFQQLHDNGTLWVPSEQKMIEDEKLQGKIKRAKLRLLQKRKEEEAEAKILRILNNADNTKSQGQVEVGDENMLTGGGGEEFDDEEEEDEEEEDEMLNSALRLGKPLTKALSKKEMLVDRIKDKTKQTVANIQEKIKRSKLKDLEHEARLDVLRQENEKSYLDSTDYEKFAIIDKFAERVKQRNVDEIFQRPDFSESEKNVDKAPGEKQKPYELLYAKEPEDKENVDINEDALFRKMRHVYDITKNHPYQHYEEYCDDLIREHVDNAKDCDTLLNQGLELVFMYERQQLTADDHVNKRVDMNAVDDDDEGDDASDKANRLSSSKQPGPNKLQTVDEEDEDE